MTTQTTREEQVAEAGVAWAGSVRTLLREEGRPATGGWPGTMSEARARIPHHLGRGLGAVELAHLAKVLYRAAKDSWHRSTMPEDA